MPDDIHGMPKYGPEHLPKVNAMRKADSQPDFQGIPILHDSDVLFVRASEMGNKPASCYTCVFKNARTETCALIGPSVLVKKVQKDGIEYWPCCGMHEYGEPNRGNPEYCAANSPSTLSLVWINAPRSDQQYGGANCGGANGGDDCDHYLIESGDKRESESGFCRVLQHSVGSGDVCSAWRDDDILAWEQAQTLLQGPSDQREKKRLVSSIMKED